MADRQVAQEAILAEDTIFKIRRSGQTDYAIFEDVIDETVEFTPTGNEAKKFVAISAKALTTAASIEDLKSPFIVWLTTNELELFRIVFGQETQTGTAPYVYKFNTETVGQDCDFLITGTRYGSSTEKATLTGANAQIRLTSLGIEKGGLWKFKCEITISAANLDFTVTSDTTLT